MTTSKKDPQSVNTGGGAHIGGNVKVRGNFVGRDMHVSTNIQGASLEEFTTLLSQLRDLLPQSGLKPKVAEVVDADFSEVEQQVDKASPNGALIKSRLGGIVETIKTAGSTSDAAVKILGLLTKLSVLAGTLFP